MLTCVAIAGVLLLFGAHFLLQRQRLAATAAGPRAFICWTLLLLAGSGAGQRLPYIVSGSFGAAV